MLSWQVWVKWNKSSGLREVLAFRRGVQSTLPLEPDGPGQILVPSLSVGEPGPVTNLSKPLI